MQKKPTPLNGFEQRVEVCAEKLRRIGQEAEIEQFTNVVAIMRTASNFIRDERQQMVAHQLIERHHTTKTSWKPKRGIIAREAWAMFQKGKKRLNKLALATAQKTYKARYVRFIRLCVDEQAQDVAAEAVLQQKISSRQLGRIVQIWRCTQYPNAAEKAILAGKITREELERLQNLTFRQFVAEFEL